MISGDYLRYYLTVIAPERADSNFVWDEFQNRVNGEFADIFGNLVNRSLTFVKRFSAGKIPPLKKVREEDQAILDQIKATKDNMTDAIEHYQFKRALAEWINLARVGNQYFQKSAPWDLQKTDPDACGTVLHICSLLVKNLAVLGAPSSVHCAKNLGNTGLTAGARQNWEDIAIIPSKQTSDS